MKLLAGPMEKAKRDISVGLPISSHIKYRIKKLDYTIVNIIIFIVLIDVHAVHTADWRNQE